MSHWEWRLPDHGGPWTEVVTGRWTASETAELAAEDFFRRYPGDYPSDGLVVEVRSLSTKALFHYRVVVEARPEFEARPISGRLR